MSVLFPLRLSLQVAVCATVVTLLLGMPLAYILARKRFKGRELLDLFLTIPMVLPPGHSETQTALRVVIPLSSRGIIAGATLAFARAMGEFGATIMVAGNIPGKTDTMPLAIFSQSSGGTWGTALWVVLVLVVVSGAVMYVSNRLGRRAAPA